MGAETGQLGAITAPNQATFYTYDLLTGKHNKYKENTMTDLRITACFVLLTVVLFTGHGIFAQENETTAGKITARGKVVAYDLFPAYSRHLQPKNPPYDLILKIEQWVKGKEDGRYIIIRYLSGTSKSKLPAYFFDGLTNITIRLERTPSCDRIVPKTVPLRSVNSKQNTTLPALTYTQSSVPESLTDSMLPCYVFDKNDLAKSKLK